MTDQQFAMNCSLALGDIPLLDRARQARRLGYEELEWWWPFESGRPQPQEVSAFVDSVKDAGAGVVLFNFPGGGASVDDRGLLAITGREDDFLSSARTAVQIGSRLGVTKYNPMTGNVVGGLKPGSPAFRTAVNNLVRVDPIMRDAGATIVIEPLSGFPDAALKTISETVALISAARDAGAENVSLLLDLYHMAMNDDAAALATLDGSLIGHVQIADAPGRGWPGEGKLPLRSWLADVRRAGYHGTVGMECSGATLSYADLCAHFDAASCRTHPRPH